MGALHDMSLYPRGLRSKVRRAAPANLVAGARAVVDPRALIVDWVNRGPVKDNWGDAIAPVLAELLSGRQVVNVRDIVTTANKPVYTTIGSMLGTIAARNVEVWGSGFVDSSHSMKVRPRAIHAVRGPLTRQRLLDSGLDCPDVVGDPALLYPLFYRPEVPKQYRLGVIPHFRDHELPAAQRLGEHDDVLVIDLMAGITEVADQINACERIASSSLHGLVAGDGYGIPSIWVRFSDRPYGDGFKFRDYLASVGRAGEPEPLMVTTSTSPDEIHDRFPDYRIDIDLDAFLSACPFLDQGAVERNRTAGVGRPV